MAKKAKLVVGYSPVPDLYNTGKVIWDLMTEWPFLARFPAERVLAKLFEERTGKRLSVVARGRNMVRIRIPRGMRMQQLRPFFLEVEKRTKFFKPAEKKINGRRKK